jgi:hypothetical protein
MQSGMITETLVCEVTNVEHNSRYLNGYSKPAVEFNSIELTGGSDSGGILRAAKITVPGELPIGTRFRVIIEQIDTVEPATIRRGALPNIVDEKLLDGGEGQASSV